jgi:hypothetical protein
MVVRHSRDLLVEGDTRAGLKERGKVNAVKMGRDLPQPNPENCTEVGKRT